MELTLNRSGFGKISDNKFQFFFLRFSKWKIPNKHSISFEINWRGKEVKKTSKILEFIDINYLSIIADQTAKTASTLCDIKVDDFLIVIYHLYLDAFEKKLKAIYAINIITKNQTIDEKMLQDLGHSLITINSTLEIEQQITDHSVKEFIKNNVVQLRYAGYPLVPYSPDTLAKLQSEYTRLISVFTELSAKL